MVSPDTVEQVRALPRPGDMPSPETVVAAALLRQAVEEITQVVQTATDAGEVRYLRRLLHNEWANLGFQVSCCDEKLAGL